MRARLSESAAPMAYLLLRARTRARGAHHQHARTCNLHGRAPAGGAEEKSFAKELTRISPNSAFGMSFGDFKAGSDVCAHVPKYWRFQFFAWRFRFGALVSEEDEEGVAAEEDDRPGDWRPL